LDDVLTIELFGHPFTFKTEAELSEAKEVADFLVQEVNKVEDQLVDKAANVTKRAILILAALNITNEYFEFKKDHQQLLQLLSEKSQHLLNELDASVT
jgi:cell division protein ZapA (FtsZ GTPase activity inhibitor)